MQFVDRFLKCADCGSDFIFTAGEQLFFYDKQFKNDPKRCKLCKAKRAGLGRSSGNGMTELPLSRTETRTQCSACGVETTVPFKPTQGRPVLCRSCFQLKRVPPGVAAVSAVQSPVGQNGSAIGDTAGMSSTMDMISEAPAAAIGVAEHDPSARAELMAMAADAPRA